MRKKHKSFSRWQHGIDNKFKAKNMDEEKKEPNNLGFIYEPIAPEDYQLGACEFGREIIMPDGDWTGYLPSGEDQQKAGVETMACVSFSACNNIEMIMEWMIDNDKISPTNMKWLQDNGYLDASGILNFSDRFVAKLSGTTTNGNSLKNVGEAIRKHGLVPESKWPFTAGMNWATYYKYPSGEVIKLGRDFLERFQINYEVVPEGQFKDGLKFAPLQTAVHAWNGRDNEGHYIKCAGSLNHAISLFRQVAIKLLWGVFDHYKLGDSFIKWLNPDFNLMDYGYRYLVTEKNPQTPVLPEIPEDAVFKTTCSGYLNYAPGIVIEKGTWLTHEEAMAWVPAPAQGESLPQIQWDVNPRKEETGWQMLLKAIKKLLGYGR